MNNKVKSTSYRLVVMKLTFKMLIRASVKKNPTLNRRGS